MASTSLLPIRILLGSQWMKTHIDRALLCNAAFLPLYEMQRGAKGCCIPRMTPSDMSP